MHQLLISKPESCHQGRASGEGEVKKSLGAQGDLVSELWLGNRPVLAPALPFLPRALPVRNAFPHTTALPFARELRGRGAFPVCVLRRSQPSDCGFLWSLEPTLCGFVVFFTGEETEENCSEVRCSQGHTEVPGSCSAVPLGSYH